jgi:O-methyltransferase
MGFGCLRGSCSDSDATTDRSQARVGHPRPAPSRLAWFRPLVRSRLRHLSRRRALDRWARLIPAQALRPVAFPLGRHLRTDDGFVWESARMLNDAFGYVRNERVAGDYAEFGVLEGRTFVEAWYAARRHGLDHMRLHAYDSFEGLPDVGGVDRGGPFQSGQFASPRAVFDDVTSPVPDARKTVIQGFYDATLPQAEKRPVAIAWVDCDLYESTVPVLDFLTDQLQDGSVLIFDDWFCFHGRPDRGEQRACGEWLEAHPEIRLVPYRDFHWAGRSFLVNR